jgi:NADH-quinone oxidoreductase subunit G
MSMAVATDLVTLTIDGQEVKAAKGTLILDAAKQLGIDIPIFCSHPKLDPVAVCRMCLIQVEKMPKLQPACAIPVAEGMVVHTDTPVVEEFRKGVLELLLINHPLDCPICDKGGECPLQDHTYRYGPPASRFTFQKVHFDKAVPLSDKIVLDRERCILCWRCTRFTDEISGEKELALIQRGVHTLIGTFNDQPAQSEFQGNWTEICPVGALTARQYRFVSRPWDLDRTPSVCPGCPMGCNIHVDTRHNKVVRFQSREQPEIDDGWLCDMGRYSHWRFNDETRIVYPLVRRNGRLERVLYREALDRAAALLRNGAPTSLAGWSAPSATNEELYLFQRLLREVLKSPHLDHGAGDARDPAPDDYGLSIAGIEACSHVVVLGDALAAAPVLKLRLHKAERKRATLRLEGSPDSAEALARQIPDNARQVGVISTEGDKRAAIALVHALSQRTKGPVLRLAVPRGPNGRGALQLGILPTHGPGYRPLAQPGRGLAEWGSIQTLFWYNPSPIDHGSPDPNALARIPTVVAMAFRPDAVTERAQVVLPARSFAEKDGTFTNMEGRAQRIRPALDVGMAVREDWWVFAELARCLGASWGYAASAAVSEEAARAARP